MFEDKIRVGVLGAARIVPSALLVPARGRKDLVVTHVAAREADRARDFGTEHGLQPVESYDALLARDDLDLIYIAVPPSNHREWTIRALGAGKAVLCEKPFAMNAAQAQDMVAASAATGRPLIEAFHYRFHPAILRATRMLRDGAIGAITGARASFCTTIPEVPGEFRWNGALGGGAVMDLGCYPIHALRTLIGSEPEIIAARAEYAGDVEAEATAELLFSGRIRATIECGMRSVERKWDLEVEGECGRLTLSNFVVPHYGCALSIESDGVRSTESFGEPSTYAAQLAHVADVLLRGAAPVTGGQDSIANMEAIDAVRAKAGSNAQ